MDKALLAVSPPLLQCLAGAVLPHQAIEKIVDITKRIIFTDSNQSQNIDEKNESDEKDESEDNYPNESQDNLHMDEWSEYKRLYCAAKELDSDHLAQLLSAIPSLEKRARLVTLHPPQLIGLFKLKEHRGRQETEYRRTSEQSSETVLQTAAANSRKHLEVIAEYLKLE